MILREELFLVFSVELLLRVHSEKLKINPTL